MLHPKTTISLWISHPKNPYGVGHAALQPPAAPLLPHLTASVGGGGHGPLLGSPSVNPGPHRSLAAVMASMVPPVHLWGHPGLNSSLPLPQQGLSYPEL